MARIFREYCGNTNHDATNTYYTERKEPFTADMYDSEEICYMQKDKRDTLRNEFEAKGIIDRYECFKIFDFSKYEQGDSIVLRQEYDLETDTVTDVYLMGEDGKRYKLVEVD